MNVLGLLGGIPWSAIALVGVAAWGGYGHLKHHETQAAFQKYIAEVNKAGREEEQERRALEQWRVQTRDEVTRAQAQTRAREAVATRADDAAVGRALGQLFLDIAADRDRAAQRTGADAAAAAECEATSAAYRELSAACVASYGELARDAHAALGASRSAGVECEQLYDKMTITRPPAP